MRFVEIQFDAPVFDKVTLDKAGTFIDQLLAVSGTMDLLTGFSIISGVEITYFTVKIVLSYCKRCKRKMCKKSIDDVKSKELILVQSAA